MKQKICPFCGAEFSGNYQKTFCSKTCRQKSWLAQQRESYKDDFKRKDKQKPVPKKKPTSILEIQAKASALGLSYGKYIAKYGG